MEEEGQEIIYVIPPYTFLAEMPPLPDSGTTSTSAGTGIDTVASTNVDPPDPGPEVPAVLSPNSATIAAAVNLDISALLGQAPQFGLGIDHPMPDAPLYVPGPFQLKCDEFNNLSPDEKMARTRQDGTIIDWEIHQLEATPGADPTDLPDVGDRPVWPVNGDIQWLHGGTAAIDPWAESLRPFTFNNCSVGLTYPAVNSSEHDETPPKQRCLNLVSNCSGIFIGHIEQVMCGLQDGDPDRITLGNYCSDPTLLLEPYDDGLIYTRLTDVT